MGTGVEVLHVLPTLSIIDSKLDHGPKCIW